VFSLAGIFNFTKPNPQTIVAIDLETAGSLGNSAIVEISCVKSVSGVVTEELTTLVNGEVSEFNQFAANVHNIFIEDTLEHKTWKEIYPEIELFFKDADMIVSFGSFDKSTIDKACSRYQLRTLTDNRWIDLGTYEEYSSGSLAVNLSETEFVLRHHHAGSDSRGALFLAHLHQLTCP